MLQDWTIKARLAALVLALAVPLNILIAAAIWQLARVGSETQRAGLHYTARAVAMAIDAQLGKYISLAQSLANAPTLLVDDLGAFEVDARRSLANDSDAWILVADLDGQQLSNTAAKSGQPLPRRSGSAIAAQQHALKKRVLTVSETIWVGPVANSYVATIEVPIFKDGMPFRALAVIMTLQGFQRLLIGQQAPQGWLTGIIDGDGRFLARVPDHGRQVGQLASAGWRRVKDADGIFEFKSLEGNDIVHANARPSLVGWSVGIAAERSQIRAATWEAIRWTAIPGVLLSALSLVFALSIARRITNPLNSLRESVPALMQGGPVTLHEPSPEIKELAMALHKAGLERKLAEDASLRLAAIVRSSFDAIISKTLGGIITSWNASAEKMFGYGSAEAVGKSIRMLIPPERQQEEDDILAKLALNQRVEPFETVRLHKDGHPIPVSITISPITDASGHVVGASKIARDISERKAQEQQVQLLVRELSHRSKNMLAVIQSIALRSAAGSSPEFIKAFCDRLHALAINQDLLTANEWHGVDVDALVKAQLQPFADFGGSRIRAQGSPVRLSAAAAQSLGMALHELATNACKYGALSREGGHIEIAWNVANKEFEMSWTESNGPKVEKPSRRGFGSLVISTMVELSLDGRVDMDYAERGFNWRVRCPLSQVVELEPDLSLDGVAG
jgi:PAS domain S-box-containing protein